MCWVAWKTLANPKKMGGLGFREVEDFNSALLGKLSWRLLNNPLCLLSRVLLGKYCKDLSFLEVKQANNSSHGWQSILVGRDLIAPHTIKAIGDGKNTNIWRDSWILNAEIRAPVGPAPEETKDLRVSDLFKQGTTVWDSHKINQICPELADAIQCIKPSSKGAHDSYHWLHTTSGIYSSKSGYYVKAAYEDNPTPNHLIQQPMMWIKDLWAQAFSPKLKIFIWKIIQRALPIGENLKSRGLLHLSKCPRCSEEETAKHLFFDCVFAKNFWEQAPLQTSMSIGEVETFEDALRKGTKIAALPPSGVGSGPLFPWLCWTLWTARNKLIFQNRVFTAADCISKAVSEASNWGKAQIPDSRKQKAHSIHNQIGHRKLGTFSLNSDGAWKEHRNEAGIGWIIKNSSNEEICKNSEKLSFVNDPLMAEALALRAGLHAAIQSKISDIQVYSDSQILISSIRAKESNRKIYGQIEDILRLAAEFLKIEFFQIPRSENHEADSLAKQVFSPPDFASTSLLSPFPSPISVVRISV